MSVTNAESAYRQAALHGATLINVLTIAYDAMAADLRDAGKACAEGDIQARCNASNHALLLLGHLETWADMLDDPALIASLKQFYHFVRSRVLQLQVEQDSHQFQEISQRILEVRSAWQQKAEAASRVATPAPSPIQLESAPQHTATSSRSSWCA